MEKIVNNVANQLTQLGVDNPEIAIILGSGLANIAESIEDKIVIPFNKIEGMPITNVKGHKNQFIYGKINGKKVLAMQGRFHLYDGFTAKQVCLPIYVFKKLGIKTTIITNASGSLNESIGVGSIMMITDHINFTGQNALIGGAILDFGEQFIDMSEPYSLRLQNIAVNVAKQSNIELKKGIYAQVMGPMYETTAQSKMLNICGCDAVGMSTVIEVECAVQCNMQVLGLSVITDMALKSDNIKTSHEEILEQSKLSSLKLKEIIYNFIKNINE